MLRELLVGRLEVAAQEEAISQFTLMLEKPETQTTKADEVRKQQLLLNIRRIKEKLELAEAAYSHRSKLAGKGSSSQREVQTARAEFELARMEMERASRVSDNANLPCAGFGKPEIRFRNLISF